MLGILPAGPVGHKLIINNRQHCNNITKVKTNVSINGQIFKGRVLIHCAVGTAAVCNELY